MEVAVSDFQILCVNRFMHSEDKRDKVPASKEPRTETIR